MNDIQLLYTIPASINPEFSGSNQMEIAEFVQKDQLSQQRKKILLSDAVHKISSDINYN